MTLQQDDALGNIIDVDVREVWPHEAYNFTPWLAGNLEKLGKAQGNCILIFWHNQHQIL